MAKVQNWRIGELANWRIGELANFSISKLKSVSGEAQSVEHNNCLFYFC